MQLKTKALYNLIRFTAYHNPGVNIKRWQIENLRKIDQGHLFKKLAELDVGITEDLFFKYANTIESPEEMTKILSDKEDEVRDRIYLIIFELYRRNFSQRKSLSIFLDELDHRIFLYDTDQLKSDELIQDALVHLKNILDNNVDLGISHKEAFQSLLQYLAHDLENFLFDYISEQIDINNEVYAQDLIDWFNPYVNKRLFFDFLKAKLLSLKDIASANEILENIFSQLVKTPDLDLQFKILEFMISIGDRNLFVKIIKKTAGLLKKEKDLKKLLNITLDFYIRLDRDDKEKEISSLIDQREKISRDKDLDMKDVETFISLLS